jgi:hypothetical protein
LLLKVRFHIEFLAPKFVCFLVSFDRSNIYTHQERVLLLLKVSFRIEFLAPKFVKVRGSYTRYFVIVYVFYY